MSRVAPKLRRALELLRLSYRLSFSAAEVNSLLLVGFTNVWTLLPHALGQIPINIPGPTHGRLVDIHICHCSLPTGLGNLLGPKVRRLRLWDCWPIHKAAEPIRSLLEGLRSLPLESLVWCDEPHASEQQSDTDKHAPSQLLDTLTGRGLRQLGLSLRDARHQDQPTNAEELAANEQVWLHLASSLDALVFLGTSHGTDTGGYPAVEIYGALTNALASASFVCLQELQMGVDKMSIVLEGLTLEGVSGLAALGMVCPQLMSVGAIECSWRNPSLHFESLQMVSTSADAPVSPLRHLTSLRLYINSPSGCPNSLDDEWGCASADSDPNAACAMSHAVHNTIYRLPSVRRVFIEWYDEQHVPLDKLARVLAPLGWGGQLRECHLLRVNSDCGGMALPASAFLLGGQDNDTAVDEARASAYLQAYFQGLHVSVRYHGKQTRNGEDAPDWIVEDAVGMSSICCRLAVPYGGH
eukprot:CAMPEP_0181245010 /NCGR_PEP_ID=MMETSP1096-20121128/43179_1 /TAXON_ID=156174 ORGANISM="Chrysochromulina ericina, Strain CCMP281" /NCGR_SAMPLE_ID=MMETSP1096 /ASSEMBLY_ACC=CAM_ASM_000453 /LENGTH=467 /DNA_ID=CAMNT_0023341625 /DNA_START=213 /DNA_END=1616 /DNA_ORIENTATION=-